jgi:hypothetical protein
MGMLLSVRWHLRFWVDWYKMVIHLSIRYASLRREAEKTLFETEKISYDTVIPQGRPAAESSMQFDIFRNFKSGFSPIDLSITDGAL